LERIKAYIDVHQHARTYIDTPSKVGKPKHITTFKKEGIKKRPQIKRGRFNGGRYWTRTSDPLRVKQVL
jgi:hypothetical protein